MCGKGINLNKTENAKTLKSIRKKTVGFGSVDRAFVSFSHVVVFCGGVLEDCLLVSVGRTGFVVSCFSSSVEARVKGKMGGLLHLPARLHFTDGHSGACSKGSECTLHNNIECAQSMQCRYYTQEEYERVTNI